MKQTPIDIHARAVSIHLTEEESESDAQGYTFNYRDALSLLVWQDVCGNPLQD